jgi:hypothetical protein
VTFAGLRQPFKFEFDFRRRVEDFHFLVSWYSGSGQRSPTRLGAQIIATRFFDVQKFSISPPTQMFYKRAGRYGSIRASPESACKTLRL